MRPITTPADADRLVFAALLEVLDDLDYVGRQFSNHSHGFRLQRGSVTFFREANESS